MEQFKREDYITQTEAVKAHKLSIRAFKQMVEGLPFIERKSRLMASYNITYNVDIKYYLKADFLERFEMIKKQLSS